MELASCSHCGNGAEVLRVHRNQQSFASRLPGAFRFPFHVSTLLTLLGTGFAVWMMAHLGCLGGLIGFGILWSVLFTVIRQTGDGRSEIMLDFGDSISDIGYPAIAGLVGTAIVWVPPVVYAYNRAGGRPLYAEPIFWGLLALGVFYAPMAIVVAATKSPFLRMLNPVAVLGYALKLGTDYLLAVFVLVLLAGADVVFSIAAGWVIGFLPHLPVISDWLQLTATMVMPLVGAHILGLLLLTRGDDLGWGDARDYQQPLLKDAVPRGPEHVREEAPGSPRSHAPIELDPAAAPAPARSHAPIELDEPPPRATALDPAALPPLPEAKQQIEAALAAGRVADALELYAAQASPPDLAQPLHLLLGQAAVSHGDLKLGVKALRAASKDPGAPETPRAMVLLGRLYAEKLGETEVAIRLFEFVVEKYPGTPAAEFAQSRLIT